MKIAGIIAEYNPFHQGHAWHIRRTRAHCDAVVVCMAGSYTQRGAAACLSKWDRTQMALMCGADAVFELPALFAVRPADAFARGGVGILDGLGVDLLSFGSESDDANFLRRLAALRAREPAELTLTLREGLDQGLSHARAWGAAAAKLLGAAEEMVSAPNVILAAEYIRALEERGSNMTILPVPRRGGYHDDHPGDGFASASAVRLALKEGRMDDALKWTPEAARSILKNAPRMHDPDDLILHTLRRMTLSEIAALPDVAEGLENRIHAAALEASGLEDLLSRAKCRRYTHARLRRLTAHAMLGLTQDAVLRHPTPEYARLIGMREDARPVLRELSRRTRLPILSDPAKLKDDELFQYDVRATDLRALQCDAPEDRAAGQDWRQRFVRV